MTVYKSSSQAGGEIAPEFYFRPDLVKYATGARKLRNWFVSRTGSLENRPGSRYVAEVHTSAQAARLIPFIFNDANAFILVFNALKMRVIKDGGQISDSSVAITGITQDNPGEVTTGGHTFANGDEVAISGVLGMTELNGRNFKIANITGTTFELQDMDAVNFDTSGLTAYSSAGTAARIFEVATPYAAADLNGIRFAQSADVMTLVHPGHFIQEVKRLSDTSWTITRVPTIPSAPRPDDMRVSVSTPAGSLDISYIVTAVRLSNNEESGAGVSDDVSVSAITQANPGVVTTPGHTFAVGEEAIFYKLLGGEPSGMPEVHHRTFTISSSATPVFGIKEDTTNFTLETFTDLRVGRKGLHLTSVLLPTPAVPMTVRCDSVGDADLFIYRWYRRDITSGVYGFVGTAVELIPSVVFFVDEGFTPDLTRQPPIERMPFFKAGLFPGAVAYFQQRLCFGGSDDEPETIYCSNIGFFPNYYTYVPSTDASPVIFTTAGQKLSKVKHMLDVGALIVFGSSIEWLIQGDTNGSLKPTAINPFAQSYHGSANRRPVVVGGTALFLQNRDTKVRDLAFAENDRYIGNDLSIFASHLFDNFTIDDWDLQVIPHSILWAVRSDGKLVAMTLVPEHEVVAWHTHDWTDGTVENVAVIPEGNEDRVYVVVKRTINSRVSRYVEELATRQVDTENVEESVFLDGYLTFDGRKRGAELSIDMTLSGGPAWDETIELTLTASAAFFAATDVGNAIHLRGASKEEIVFIIDSFTSTTVVKGRVNKDVPADLQAVLTSDWDYAVDQVGGLWHLEGEKVSIFADGFVLANPNNDAYATIVTITNGIATMPGGRTFSIIHVGKPITADIETLDLDTSQGETMIDKKKLISAVILGVDQTRGLFIAPSDPGDDLIKSVPNGGFFAELRLRDEEDMADPVALKTGAVDTEIFSGWSEGGRIFIRQSDPLPAKVMVIAQAGYIPFR